MTVLLDCRKVKRIEMLVAKYPSEKLRCAVLLLFRTLRKVALRGDYMIPAKFECGLCSLSHIDTTHYHPRLREVFFAYRKDVHSILLDSYPLTRLRSLCLRNRTHDFPPLPAQASNFGVPQVDLRERLVLRSCVVPCSLAPEPDPLRKLSNRPGTHRPNFMCLARKRSTLP